jgi:hypothetical protein
MGGKLFQKRNIKEKKRKNKKGNKKKKSSFKIQKKE